MCVHCKNYVIPVHVAGTCMIAQGSYGLSRGNFTEGCLKGAKVLDLIPLDKSVVDRSPKVMDRIDDWTGSDELELLDPVG